jgi:hypothetical protein
MGRRRKPIPCPTCEGQHNVYFTEDAICRHCLNALEVGRKTLQDNETGKKDKIALELGDSFLYQLPPELVDVGAFHFSFDNHISLPRDLLLLAGATHLGQTNGNRWAPQFQVGPSEYNQSILSAYAFCDNSGWSGFVTREQAELIFNITRAVGLAIYEAREKGRREGSDVVGKLARGEATIQDYNSLRDGPTKKGG